MTLTDKLRLQAGAVWLSRIIVGATFIVSGWAKAIDPRGFVIKVSEYLAVWDWTVPGEAVLTACVALACIEFAVGVLVASGALKRVSVWVAAAMMLFLLPLTAYIYVADPVSDCGCFGEFLVISNGATLLKNIVLTALIVFLLICNRTVRGIYPAPIQWLVVVVSMAFPLFLALVGYQIQPLVDFRKYPLGSYIFTPAQEQNGDAVGPDTYYIYEKDGRTEQFELDALPDSTWTFVDAVIPEDVADAEGIGVLNIYGDDVTEDIIDYDGTQLFLIVTDPGVRFLSWAHFVSELYDYAEAHGVGMVAVVGASETALEQWVEWIRPRFPVYTSDASALKQLVRGEAALVYTDNGIIRWKRTLTPTDIHFDQPDAFEQVKPIDNGYVHSVAVALYLASLLIIYLFGLSPKILRFFMPKNNKNSLTLQSEKETNSKHN